MPRQLPIWSHTLFATMMVALGGVGIYLQDFSPVLLPVQEQLPARSLLIYLAAGVPLVAGLELYRTRNAARASQILFGFLFVWMVAMKLPAIAFAPISQESWSGTGEFAVVLAAAWIIYIFDATGQGSRYTKVMTGTHALRVAQALYGLALIPFGTAHFVYLKQTAELVPAWLPFPLAWAIATGSAFIAAGVAIVVGRCASLAAGLSALQISLFTLLVWLPIIAAGSSQAFQWSETIISFALSISAITVAASYRRGSLTHAADLPPSAAPR